MKTREEVIAECLKFEGAYEDYPFNDNNWTLMRHRSNKKMFAAIFMRFRKIWLNVKCDPIMTHHWRSEYESVVPAYHMNKEHWNSIILDGTIPTEDIKTMLYHSYCLTEKKIKKTVDNH